jgi:nucleoside-diphosphate-sugar epimerase
MDAPAADSLSEFRKVNTEGTKQLAREAVKAGVKRLVFISTIKVNGEEADIPFTEDSPTQPADPYGISKWEAEQALRRIEAEDGLEVAVVRPTLVYGPGVKANFLSMMKAVYRVIWQILWRDASRNLSRQERLTWSAMVTMSRHRISSDEQLLRWA